MKYKDGNLELASKFHLLEGPIIGVNKLEGTCRPYLQIHCRISQSPNIVVGFRRKSEILKSPEAHSRTLVQGQRLTHEFSEDKCQLITLSNWD
ncbi:hypothetical protein CEXT_85431 [Caerostris extrusa]|uniref:Uncharacterized protein n=1 Tax=Caerostris extrusa TaxID=172846 RepID=A0AAV4UR87_CAEEX|nr:hypothetical protein CEXT_85431 [Caerostris extrusa]